MMEMTTTLQPPRDISAALRQIEQTAVNVSAAVAPAGALFPAAWITADHMIRYMEIPGPAACIMAIGLELMGLAIVSTRVALIGRNLQFLERRMDWSFGGYLAIVVMVNGILAGVNITGVSPIASEIGRAAAGLVVALMALPASQLVGVRHELNQMQTDKLVAQEREDSRYAIDKAEAAQIRKEQREERAAIRAEKLAQLVSQPKQPVVQPAQPAAGRIDPVALAAAMVANPNATHAQLAQLFGVSGSAIGKYLRNQKGKVQP